MSAIINNEIFEKAAIAQLKEVFAKVQPYRHLIIDNFFTDPVAQALQAHFPTVAELKTHWKGLNENKSEGSNFEDFHPTFNEIRQAMSSQKVYDWVSEITGIADVFITDDALGTGLHQGTNGSFLDIHIDFNIHHIKNVHRRLNLLVYLEKYWKDSYGGHLEMWNKDMTVCEKLVLPKFNRCVIFETSEISYHGYSKITIPEGVTRKSFFSYFYTEQRVGATTYHDTLFKTRPNESLNKKVKTAVKETVKNKAKATLKKLGIKF